MRSKFMYLLVALFMGATSLYAQEKTYKYHPEKNRLELKNFKKPSVAQLKAYDVKEDGIVYSSYKEAIDYLFRFNYTTISDFGTYELYSYYTTQEKIDFLVDRGILVPLYPSSEYNMNAKYYTTKFIEVHLSFHLMKDSCYIISGPPFLAPIRPWNSIVLTELVNLDERHLSNEEKLKILLQRGVLKKLTTKDDLKKLNKVTITRRTQNPAFVDSVLKSNKERNKIRDTIFYQWFETVRDSLEKRVENEK